MAHRSLPPSDPDPGVDPFWHDAFAQPSPWRERLAAARTALRSWALVALGVALVGGVGWWLLRPSAAPIESALPMAGAPASPSGGSPTGSAAPSSASSTGLTSTSTVPPDVVVQAAGAVAKPGVYSLVSGARVDDLVDAAGGLAKDADLDRVNLAAPLSDGERVWIPAAGEAEVPEVVAGTGGGGSGSAAGSVPADGGAGGGSAVPSEPVDLNAATAEELDALPGVGPATATAILSYREEHGRFSSVEELLDVRGIGDAKLEQLRPLVRV